MIMAWLRKILFFKKTQKFRTKDAEVLGNTIPALMCLSGYVRSIVGILNTVSPHILYKHTIPKSICHVELHSNVPLSVAWYNTQTLDGTSNKIWCIYLKIIKFYLISIFWINIHDEFDETLKLCGPRTHIQQSWISRFNFLSEHSYKLREMLIWIYIQKN